MADHPDPHAVDDLELERTAVGAWIPDQVTDVGGWLLRASEGFTGRGNSALALAPVVDLDARLRDVVTWYRARDLPPWIAVPLPARHDLATALDTRGWTVHHGGRVLVRDLAGIATTPGAASVAIGNRLGQDWVERYRHRGQDLPDAGRRLLERGDHVGLAAVRDGDEVVAIGRGALVDGPGGPWLGINAVETAPSHRRRGLATDVLAALATWARDRGATAAFLQVDLANDVAHRVYERAGFVTHHTYHYLAAPPGTDPVRP